MTSLSTRTSPEPRSAILVSVHAHPVTEAQADTSARELTQLLGSLGIPVLASLRQHRTTPLDAVVLGRGKLEELTRLVADAQERGDARLHIVFDGDLTPGQQRHLARATGVPVIDRSQVILRVFSQRARTPTARLEIELATLQYELPRVRDEARVMDRQGGGGGRAARGDTNVALRKQELRRQLATARAELTRTGKVARARQQRREGAARVALVGYTNAGKSSWMRALTGSAVPVEDALFVTLDTTVRALHPPVTPPVMVADTVGFLRNLPNHLIASFRSTLDEALDAELLLLVVDGADPEWRAELAVTREVLEHVGAGELPLLVLVNKQDKMSAAAREELQAELPDALQVSVRSTDDVGRVHRAIAEHFERRLERARLRVPFTDADVRAEIWAHARVLGQQHDETATELEVRAEPALLARWRERLAI